MNRRDLVFLFLSLVVHGAIVAFLLTVPLDLPDDFEFALPAEVEFGVVEELSAEIPVVEAEPEPQKTPRARPVKEDEPGPEATEEPEPQETPEPAVETRPSGIPPGSQIALRIDMTRVREARLSGAARKLIRQIPDWHYLAGGSGIDPIDGLDRLLIATPDPRRRDLIVLAGKSVGDQDTIREATTTLAASQGRTAEFTRAHCLPTAPWHSIDPTERIIALVGPRHFTITPPHVLPTLLAMTRHRERKASNEGLESAAGPDALLSLGEGDVISIEVENVARYARRLPCPVPEKGRASIRETASGVAIDALVFHEDAEGAEEASACWDELRRTYSNHILVRLVGLGDALDRATLERSEDSVRITVSLTDAQARKVLDLVGAQIASFTGYRPPPAEGVEPSPGGEPSGPSEGDASSAEGQAREPSEPSPTEQR